MAVQVYVQNFYAERKRNDNMDIRNRALEEVNRFFFGRDSVDIVNIIEEWSNIDYQALRLIVYYKDYI